MGNYHLSPIHAMQILTFTEFDCEVAMAIVENKLKVLPHGHVRSR